MSATYRPDRAGFEAMAVGPEIRAALREIAEKAKGYAELLAADFVATGEYESSFQVEEDTAEFAGHRRAVARLRNTSDHAAAVEWGNEHVPHPHRVLGRTLDALSGL